MHMLTRLGLLLGLGLLVTAAPAAAQGTAPTAAAIAQGDSIFHKDGLCYACHGSNAEGAVGPNLTDSTWIHGEGSYDFIVATVTSGIPQDKSKSKVAMPPKGGSAITDAQVKAVAAYVWSLSHKKAGS